LTCDEHFFINYVSNDDVLCEFMESSDFRLHFARIIHSSHLKDVK